MLKKMFVLFIVFLILPAFFGCAPRVVKTELDQRFENNFQGINVPEVPKLKEEGISKSFPYASFDKVWDSTISVLIQQKIIVRVSKNTGTIVTVTGRPLIIFVERSETINVYLDYMYILYSDYIHSLYREADNPKSVTSNFTPDIKEKTAKAFFDKLATQVYADEKWKYLYKTEK